MFGRVWLYVVIVLRILVYVVAVQQVWDDDWQEFICVTRQTGCTNVCYDHFFPISPIRLWALQIILVTSPSLMVVAHTKYREMKDKKYTTTHQGKHLHAAPGKKCGGLWYTYMLSLVLRAGFDAGFLYILYIIYHFEMFSRVVKCNVSPCLNTVDCYISRPTEKTIFIFYMVVTSSICIFMCICEIFYLINKKVCTYKRKQQNQKTVNYRMDPLRVDPKASSNQNISNVHTVIVD
ncbi:gap junction beta-4 -like protein [Labeo rohita]|uniref:Gap junction beta-4 protein n=3 Tax=Labeo rohita TaxID=84645 RepID=A0ABQ8LQ67_LABRO|nr:Gap junction beta-4 protein [Labeo rohita]RXN26453.1 gap junction beta-4 -like protein [Labeo rohita]